MNDKVLLAFIVAYIDSKLKDLPQAKAPRIREKAFRFHIEDYEEEIKSYLEEVRLKFSDLTAEEINSLKGKDGTDGRDGKDFSMSDHESEIRQWIQDNRLKFSDLSDDEFESLRGKKGRDGKDGKDFVFEDHKEFFESLRLKFSDLTEEEINSLKGKDGTDGKNGHDGADGKDFEFEEHAERISNLITGAIDSIKESFILKFEHLTEEQKESLKGKDGKNGRDGRNGLNGEDGKDGANGKSAYEIAASLGFEGDQEEWIESLKGKEGKAGKDGKGFVFEDHLEFFESLRLKFSDLTTEEKSELSKKELTAEEVEKLRLKFNDLTPEQKIQLRGGRGQRGRAGDNGQSAYELAKENGFEGSELEWIKSLKGERGLQGVQGRMGLQGVRGFSGVNGTNGVDGKDAPHVTDIFIDKNEDSFRIVFYFSDGTELATNSVDFPEGEKVSSASKFFFGGGSGSGPGTTNGKDGKSAYDIAVENGFVGTEAEWLESLNGEDGADGTNGIDGTNGVDGQDGADGVNGKSAYELALDDGFIGTEQEWLDSLQGADGLDGADGKSAYEIAVDNGFVGTEEEWLESLGQKITAYDEGVGVGTFKEIDFVGDNIEATKVGDRLKVEVTVPDVDALQILPNVRCLPDVFPGAAVRLIEDNYVSANMDEWPTMAQVMTIEYGTYETVAANALGDSYDNANVIGLVENKIDADHCNIRIAGRTAENYLGLRLDEDYCLSDKYPGRLTAVSSGPTEEGHVLINLGKPVSDKRLLFVLGERLVRGPAV